ncbi:BQ2448_5240 [Microbotryum intermedium]|uniref:Dynactin subunit 4 n=1 Tax=Microbotryum intermedium TaxID=269621 RepID=A0A238F4J0_9BASI|nr:BQ2448_5240 [Microbotryum intermedium]
MSSDRVLFHCPCCEPISVKRPPPSEPPLSTFKHHELSSLLFCEECDAIRCSTCVAFEIACWYCPTCLFEVPSASVRGEKNRCARNCFQCPQCSHSLSVVPSDPDPSHPPTSAAASIGEAPYFLSCTVCRWDSKSVGIVFDKPTGLAQQLQKLDDGSSELAEFDRLKDHFEPYIRRGQAHASALTSGALDASTMPSSTSSTIASSVLKDIPGLGNRYAHLLGGIGTRSGKGAEALNGARDELEPYKTLVPAKGSVEKGKGVERDDELVHKMQGLQYFEEVAALDKRWTNSWDALEMRGVMTDSLRPLRTLLQAKRSKRCPICKHILIKPEQKAASTRFKIKLVASNYLPSIDVYRRPPATIGSRLSAIAAGTASLRRAGPRGSGIGASISGSKGMMEMDEEPLRPGRTYTFELSFTNPLYEPIQVRLAVARPTASAKTVGSARRDAVVGSDPGASTTTTTTTTTAPAPPYAVSLPSGYFPISAYAEEWEFEDDDQRMDSDDQDSEESGAGAGVGVEGGDAPKSKMARNAAMGIVERKMNRTTVAMEVAVGRDTVGPIRANMLVTYVYHNGESTSAPPGSPLQSPVKGGSGTGGGTKSASSDVKTFTFWTLFNLGTVTPRTTAGSNEARRSLMVSSSSG